MSPTRPAILKAVIPVAGRGTRHFPASATIPKELFPLVDTDGVTRTVAHIIIRAAMSAGIEEIALVVSPGQERLFRECFAEPPASLMQVLGEPARQQGRELGVIGERLRYITQESPEGFGHAVSCARDFVGRDPFLLMLGDHVPIPEAGAPSPVQQVLTAYTELGGASVTGVQTSPVENLHLHGTAAGRVLEKPADARTYRAVDMVEKPDAATARERLVTPGLPEGQFLTMFGLYAFDPEIVDILQQMVRQDRRQRGEIQLATAQEELIHSRNDYYLYLVRGQAMDMGTPAGLARTQAALCSARGNQ